MKIKVCGLKIDSQVKEASEMADYIGFIFYKKSPRYVSVAKDSSAKAKRVGVFVDECLEEVIIRIESENLDAVQLHGQESAEYCRKLKQYCEVIKAFGLSNTFDFNILLPYENQVSHFLFDTQTKNHGGSGKSFNWDILKQYKGKTTFFLSGGIRPGSISQIKNVNHSLLYGVDINSGFEVSPANKNIESIKTFIHDINS